MSAGLTGLSRLGPTLLGYRAKQRLTILIFHRVLPEYDPMRPDEPTVALFDWQMQLLRRYFSPLSLREAIARQQDNTLPERAVCVTFDDGYADNALCALPVLERYAIPASVFVSTAFLNGGRMWNDSVREALRIAPGDEFDLTDFGLERYQTSSMDERLVAAEAIIRAIKHKDPLERATLVDQIETLVGELPGDLMLTSEQLRNLGRGEVSIGAHTVNHPILSSISASQAEAEIAGSRETLQDILQKDVEQFAYPNGAPGVDYTAEHRDMVERLGFKVAVSTHWGAACKKSDPYQLPRFTPWDRSSLKFMLRLLMNYRKVDPLIIGQ
ncbi:MAG: polysaccharide deacetylase family protein [Pseudomonadales bacterium]